jgi:hypothetical protein
LATGEGFAGVITASNQLFWTSPAGTPSMTSFDSDMTLYLCAAANTHTGFQCTITALQVWPIYDESFLLSVLFGQYGNALFYWVKPD